MPCHVLPANGDEPHLGVSQNRGLSRPAVVALVAEDARSGGRGTWSESECRR
jgi:hypothetical protein